MFGLAVEDITIYELFEVYEWYQFMSVVWSIDNVVVEGTYMPTYIDQIGVHTRVIWLVIDH